MISAVFALLLPLQVPAPTGEASPKAEQGIDEAKVPEELVAGPTASAPELQDADFSLRFADHLFRDGDYYRSITEYRKYLFITKGQGDASPRAAMAVGEALMRGEQWDAAGRQLDGVAVRTLDLTLRQGALFAAGRAYLADKRPELAKLRFRLIVQDDTASAALKDDARWWLAWGHFDAGELEVAQALFAAMGTSSVKYKQKAAGMAKAIGGKGDLDMKDPLWAALFSIIPGGGHLYLGQVGTAATAFAWNALFIAAAVHAFLVGDWGVAALLTFAEFGWYSGSLFGAVSGAYRHNRDVVRNWRDSLMLQYGTTRDLPTDDAALAAPPGTMLRFSGTF
jgi:TM2 domain-containing membrane protein YozV